MISLIVAMEENQGIGKGGRIPWRLPADQQNFKTVTMGHHLIIGRKTWESIGRPLPGRVMVVITSDPGYDAPGCLIVSSLDEGLSLVRERDETECFIGGGARLYDEAFPIADRIYLTRVHASVETDVSFPEFDIREWELLESWIRVADDHNQYPFTYEVLARV